MAKSPHTKKDPQSTPLYLGCAEVVDDIEQRLHGGGASLGRLRIVRLHGQHPLLELTADVIALGQLGGLSVEWQIYKKNGRVRELEQC